MSAIVLYRYTNRDAIRFPAVMMLLVWRLKVLVFQGA